MGGVASLVAEKYAVRLSPEDQAQLERLIRRGQHLARVINRGRILLRTDDGWSASQVAVALDTSPRPVFRTKRRYAEEGLGGVRHDHPQANRYRKLADRGEAHPVSSTGPAMEDVLDLYAEPYNPHQPVSCFDETPPNCWPRCALRCPSSRDDRGGRTTSIGAAAPATSS